LSEAIRDFRGKLLRSAYAATAEERVTTAGQTREGHGVDGGLRNGNDVHGRQ
jgi:hypothetical protein